MKALEILRDIRNIETEYNHLKKHRFDQAIDELEELENRSCENCKYWFYKTLETNIETCNFGLISHDYQSDSFCCNKWEAK